MNASEVEREVVEVLRRSSLRGSDRQIGLDDALGEQGLGLDSLALVEFVTALENRFQVELPDEFWTERERLSIRHCADLIVKSNASVSPATEKYEPIPNQRSTIGLSWSQKATSAFRELGAVRGAGWILGRLGLHITDSFYLRQKYHILMFDISDQPLPSYTSLPDLILREVSAEDSDAFREFCTSIAYRTHTANKIMTVELFRERLESGYICLGAWLNDRIVGVDWLSGEGYKCPFTGLRFHWPSETCYAMELFEHTEHTGEGIGLSLLAFSLAVAKERGYESQVAMVIGKNVKMLSASVQLFGFVKIGEIDTRRILFKPFSSWQIGGDSGRGGGVLLGRPSK
jgi:acyl carrier protein/GNAT superfamily N-acetyltransferase